MTGFSVQHRRIQTNYWNTVHLITHSQLSALLRCDVVTFMKANPATPTTFSIQNNAAFRELDLFSFSGGTVRNIGPPSLNRNFRNSLIQIVVYRSQHSLELDVL